MSIRKLRTQFHPVLFFLAALCFAVAGIFTDGSLIGRFIYLLFAGIFSAVGIRDYKKQSTNSASDKSKPAD